LFRFAPAALFAISILFSLPVAAGDLPWPVKAPDGIYRIGNSHGEYQKYGPVPYFHPGIDILVPVGTPVYAISSGYVKAVLTISGSLHWRVAIGDSPGSETCDGWMYAHLSLESIPVNEGDFVEAGQYIGSVVEWPVADFHHLHLSRIRHSGERWDPDWTFIGNPIDELVPLPDSIPPKIEPTFGKQLLAFCDNETGAYFFSGAPLSGQVDIICRAGDIINAPEWKVAPYTLSYRIKGPASTPWVRSVNFSGLIAEDHDILTVYRADDVCRSYGDYNHREFFYTLTNTERTESDVPVHETGCWNTSEFPNGSYWILVRATDKAGNIALDSMEVRVYNTFAGTDAADPSKARDSRDSAAVSSFPARAALAF
jgi:hypothetical protein